jgi:hypothetical protein
VAELLRTTFDSLGNRVTFTWDAEPTPEDKAWAMQEYRRAHPGYHAKWHEWTPKPSTKGGGVDRRAHGYHGSAW